MTYPSTEVQQALKGRYQRIVLDVEDDAKLAGLLNPEVIPTAIIFDTDGKEQRRQTGHANPVDHAKWLK